MVVEKEAFVAFKHNTNMLLSRSIRRVFMDILLKKNATSSNKT